MGDSHFSDKFRSFVTRLHSAVRSERPLEDLIHTIYQDSEEVAKEYSAEPWPTAAAISGLVRDDKPFLLLYTEMAYQAFFKNKNLKPTMEHRIGSWDNYSALFNYFIDDEDGQRMREAAHVQGGDLTITGKWAFDIVYEFVYQFQDACQYRASVGSMPEHEQQLVLGRRDVWAVDKVYNLLLQLVKVSKVKEVLDAARRPDRGHHVSYPSKLHYMLGYFALVGLNRLECLLGDFEGSLEAAEPVTRETMGAPGGNLLSNILIAHVSLYYHIGLSSFMVRKYRDSLRAFVVVLEAFFKHLDVLKQQRNAQQNQQTIHGKQQEYDMGVAKLVEKVVSMLLIVLHLCPGHNVADNIRNFLNGDKQKDKIRDITSGDVEQIAKHFYQSAPKFISPTDFDDVASLSASQSGRMVSSGAFQRGVFRKEVQQMLELRKLREYLKLYSTINLDKLSSFTSEHPDEIRRELVQFKHKLLQLNAVAAQGDGSTAIDFHYFLEGDMVHVDEAEKQSRHEVAKRFQHQIDRLENLVMALRR